MKIDITVTSTILGISKEYVVEIGSDDYIKEQILEQFKDEEQDNENVIDELDELDENDINFEISDYGDLSYYDNLQDQLEELAAYTGDLDLDVLSAGVECNISFDNIDEAYAGEYKSDEDFTEEMLNSTGDLPRDFPSYIVIDWEATASNIMQDYTEENGYYFRLF